MKSLILLGIALSLLLCAHGADIHSNTPITSELSNDSTLENLPLIIYIIGSVFYLVCAALTKAFIKPYWINVLFFAGSWLSVFILAAIVIRFAMRCIKDDYNTDKPQRKTKIKWHAYVGKQRHHVIKS